MSRVAVAMSGGVDSSVAAALLKRAGHEVTGLTMVLTDENPATDPAACAAAAACEFLGIPHESVDAREVFEREVVGPFVAEYAAGRTPNPCIMCNAQVKFGWLLDRAHEGGAELLATGHYARILRADDGAPQLARAADRAKDQSYFLYAVPSETLARVILPLGDITKGHVRLIAEELGLPGAGAAESQDACFVGHEGHEALVAARVPGTSEPGPIVDSEGTVVGSHRGLAHYTVGQRKGLGIAAPEPLFVLALLPERNTVVVGPADRLQVREIVAGQVVWHDQRTHLACAVQTRYRMQPVAGAVRVGKPAGGNPQTPLTLVVALDAAVRGVAPGQAVVCYERGRVLGGGVIVSAR